jgi:hypothetical protein
MTTAKYPRGWDRTRAQRVLDYYESQTDAEAAAEIEAGLDSTTIEVPRALVPAVRQLIAKRKAARRKKTHNKGLKPSASGATRSAGSKGISPSRRLKP